MMDEETKKKVVEFCMYSTKDEILEEVVCDYKIEDVIAINNEKVVYVKLKHIKTKEEATVKFIVEPAVAL